MMTPNGMAPSKYPASMTKIKLIIL